jgi:hypothetical protein
MLGARERELYEAAFERTEQQVTRHVNRALAAAGGSSIARLHAGCRAFLAATADRRVRRVLISEPASVIGWEKWHRALDAGVLGWVRTELDGAMAEGDLERQPVDVLAELIAGTLVSASVLTAAPHPSSSAAELRHAVERVLEGLAPGRLSAGADLR